MVGLPASLSEYRNSDHSGLFQILVRITAFKNDKLKTLTFSRFVQDFAKFLLFLINGFGKKSKFRQITISTMLPCFHCPHSVCALRIMYMFKGLLTQCNTFCIYYREIHTYTKLQTYITFDGPLGFLTAFAQFGEKTPCSAGV